MFKKTMAIVPFSVVEHGVSFRYKRRWWNKKIGTVNWADSTDSAKHSPFEEDELVAIFKKNVPDKNRFEIVQEIKVNNKV